MKMSRFAQGVMVLLLVLATVSLGWAASNLNLSKSNIYRVGGAQLVSGSTSVVPGESAVVYPIAQGADFILTQFCAGPVEGGVLLSAQGFGSIARTGQSLCYSFVPGVVLPRPSELTCSIGSGAPAGDYFCTISGLLAR